MQVLEAYSQEDGEECEEGCEARGSLSDHCNFAVCDVVDVEEGAMPESGSLAPARDEGRERILSDNRCSPHSLSCAPCHGHGNGLLQGSHRSACWRGARVSCWCEAVVYAGRMWTGGGLGKKRPKMRDNIQGPTGWWGPLRTRLATTSTQHRRRISLSEPQSLSRAHSR